MWSDNESSIDLLGCEHLVSAVTSIVRNESLLPTTIGVFGDWGSGKSSLVQMVEGALKTEDGVVVLSFNGWLFEGYEDAKTALMGTILEELIDQQKLIPEMVAGAKKLLRRVDLFKAAWGLGKLAVSGYVGGPAALGLGVSGGADLAAVIAEMATKAKDLKPEELQKYLKPAEEAEQLRRSIRGFRKDFGTLLEQSKIRTLVVVIDDLDRCMPDTIIETLEAIKLFLFVPRTAFILGADERLVKYAVRKRFPELPGERAEVGRDYLEKLVQFPVRIPPLGRAEMETYINLLFARLSGITPEQFEKARQCVVNCDPAALMAVNFSLATAQRLFEKMPDGLAERLALAQRIAPVLATGLNGNPRQCKRFLNTLVMRLAMAKSRKIDLQQRVLAKLMLLEYFRPESFRRLAELQAEENGMPGVIAALERQVAETPPDLAERDSAPEGVSGRESHRQKRAKRAAAPELSMPAEQFPTIPGEFTAWLSDVWLKAWLKLEPMLAGVDLRPYFFFSRETLGPIGGYAQRMSPLAEKVFQELLYESEAVRKIALKKAGTLSAAEAAAVFEALAARAQQDEDLGSEESAFPRLFDWAEARKELRGELMLLLGRLPEKDIPPMVVPRVLQLAKGEEVEPAARKLLGRWSQSKANEALAKIAGARLV